MRGPRRRMRPSRVPRAVGLLLATLLAGAVATSPVLLRPAVASAPPTYAVTVHESGLASGVTWAASISGDEEHSSGPSILFHEPDGPYLILILPQPEYDANSSEFSINVFGQPVNVSVTFTKNTSVLVPPSNDDNGSTGSTSSLSPQVVATVLIVVLGVAVILYYVATRRRGGSGPPPSSDRRGRSRRSDADDDAAEDEDEDETASARAKRRAAARKAQRAAARKRASTDPDDETDA